MPLDKSLHMWLRTLLAMLFSGSVRTSDMWIDLSSGVEECAQCVQVCVRASQ